MKRGKTAQPGTRAPRRGADPAPARLAEAEDALAAPREEAERSRRKDGKPRKRPIGPTTPQGDQATALAARIAELRETIRLLRENVKAVRAETRADALRGMDARVNASVEERTRELTLLNEELKTEIADRIRAEEKLREESHTRKKAEEKLRALNRALEESKERFRSLVENVPVGICIVHDGEILFANPEQQRLLGTHPAAAGSGLLLNVHPDDAAALDALCRPGSAKGSPLLEADVRLLPGGSADPAAEPRWVRCRAGWVRYRGRDCLLLTLMDITRAKELEHLVAVQEKFAALGQLSAGIAHEIRNPLSGINIFLSSLEQLVDHRREPEPEDAARIRGIVEQIKSGSSKIATVIQRVIDFSKSGPPRPGEVDLNRVVEDAVQLSSTTAKKFGVTVLQKLDPVLPGCSADSHLIEQVLVNLIANGVQAMQYRDGPRLLEVSTSSENRLVVVRVSDSGPGVPEKLRKAIFDPFFTTRKDGYGIGLSFSQKVVAGHGGTIAVGTSRWGGAEFRVELPVEKEPTRA